MLPKRLPPNAPCNTPETYPEHMKKLAALAALPLALAACSSGSGDAAKTVTVSATPSSSTTATPSPGGTPYGNDPDFKISDAQYLAKMHATYGDAPTDESLRNLGKTVCKDLRAGNSVKDEILALDGTSTRDKNSFTVATAVRLYCTEYEEQVRALTK